MTEDQETALPPEQARVPLAEFLAKTPPHRHTRIHSAWAKHPDGAAVMLAPSIRIECGNCEAEIRFNSEQQTQTVLNKPLALNKGQDYVLMYRCANCLQETKRFALVLNMGGTAQFLTKIGELPAFGPKVPNRLLRHLGGEAAGLLMKGRQSENQGLGVGAFAYYRQAVERGWDGLLSSMEKAAQNLQAGEDVLAALAEARKTHGFTASLDKVVIPESLLVHGDNPLKMLHHATSEGLHAGTDEECLEIASAVRAVLIDLAQRIKVATEDHEDVKDAVKILRDTRAGKTTGGGGPAK